MLQPILSGNELLQDIEQTMLKNGQLAVWWLGQSGYAFKTASQLFYIDLYLSEHLTAKYADTAKPHIRMTAAPIRGAEIDNAGLLFASHKHSDHLDPATLPDLFRASPQAKLVLPAALVDHAADLGLDPARLIPTNGDETLNLDGLQVTVIPSAHPELDFDPQTGYPFIGFIFQTDGLSFYHSGDTVIYDGLAERLHAFDLDLAFLPVNGSEAQRQALYVPPNMNYHEALSLAREVGAKLLIPHHYDMFTFNTIPISLFEEAAQTSGQAYQILQPAQKFIYTKD